jgi:hypothetical protein
VLAEFRDLKKIAGIRSNGKKNRIVNMRNSKGELVNGKKEIMDVFADFYEALYETRQSEGSEDRWASQLCSGTPPVTAAEVKECLKGMAKKKAKDAKGVVVEMLQNASTEFLDLVASLFTDVLDADADPPSTWKTTRLMVLFKKGDPKDASNYRPISLLSILYKVFSKLICRRIGSLLDAAQPADQAGFRSGFSCDDHLLSLVLLVERSFEFQQPLWIAMVDYRKAFDTVEHSSMWKALDSAGVPGAYNHPIFSGVKKVITE